MAAIGTGLFATSIGSTSSAYFTEPKWSIVWCVDLTGFINPFNKGL